MVTSAKCCHAESHFLNATGEAEGEEGEGQWRCTVFPEGPLQLRTGDLEMNETLGHTDSPGPVGAVNSDFSHHPNPFARPVRGRGLPEGCSSADAGPPAGPHSPPPAPQLPAPLRASAAQAGPRSPSASGSRGAGTGRVGVCMPARSRGGTARRRRRRLRFAPRRCDGSRRGPKDLKALATQSCAGPTFT